MAREDHENDFGVSCAAPGIARIRGARSHFFFAPVHAFAQTASAPPAANAPAAAPAEEPLAPVVQQAGTIPANMLPHDLTPWQMFVTV